MKSRPQSSKNFVVVLKAADSSAAFPLTGIRISLLGGEMREVGSDEVAFRIAANDAFDEGLQSRHTNLARTDHADGYHYAG